MEEIELRRLEIDKFQDDMDKTIGQVFFILKEYPDTRGCDGLLICYWLQLFRGIGTFQGLFALARENEFNFETVRRSRQKIQAAGYFLPDDETVLKRRRLEEIWQYVQASGRRIS